jgi:UDP-N-acetylglucosamine 2-epimerase (non-hydrolysing)
MMTILNVVGARPQFVKAGPVSRALEQAGMREILLHTGQHYDDLMSDVIMRDVGLREPDINLAVGSVSHGVQTARILEGVERVLLHQGADAVLTYGDTNSTVAAALAAAKLGVVTAHIEAGLRSFNRSMPEELNRIATDHLSDLLLAPTNTAVTNLAHEGLADRTVLTGDVMVDALRSIDLESVAVPTWAVGDFYVATLHRPANTDDPERLRHILTAFGAVDLPVHLLAHPRLGDRLARTVPDRADTGSLIVHPPLPYGEMLAVLHTSRGLLTDSGGLQKEAFILRTPCATIRDETEWPETLEGGWNVLVGSSLDQLQIHLDRDPAESESKPFGDGDAARRIIEAVISEL